MHLGEAKKTETKPWHIILHPEWIDNIIMTLRCISLTRWFLYSFVCSSITSERYMCVLLGGVPPESAFLKTSPTRAVRLSDNSTLVGSKNQTLSWKPLQGWGETAESRDNYLFLFVRATLFAYKESKDENKCWLNRLCYNPLPFPVRMKRKYVGFPSSNVYQDIRQ